MSERVERESKLFSHNNLTPFQLGGVCDIVEGEEER